MRGLAGGTCRVVRDSQDILNFEELEQALPARRDFVCVWRSDERDGSDECMLPEMTSSTSDTTPKASYMIHPNWSRRRRVDVQMPGSIQEQD